MFYCDPCRVTNKWPGILPSSHGRCEVCGNVRPCFDVPSGRLPPLSGFALACDVKAGWRVLVKGEWRLVVSVQKTGKNWPYFQLDGPTLLHDDGLISWSECGGFACPGR